MNLNPAKFKALNESFVLRIIMSGIPLYAEEWTKGSQHLMPYIDWSAANGMMRIRFVHLLDIEKKEMARSTWYLTVRYTIYLLLTNLNNVSASI